MLHLLLFLVLLATENDASAKPSCSCGSSDKIVGGYNISIEQTPYQAFLHVYNSYTYGYCGGVIVNTRHVLTAAHCLYGFDAVDVRIASTLCFTGGITYNSTELIIHPNYNLKTHDYDIGIVILNSDMYLDGKLAKAVKLPPANFDVPAGTLLFVSGWGFTKEHGSTSEHLLGVNVPTISRLECSIKYQAMYNITERMICAGFSQGGKDACQGDSGGPAVSKTTSELVGLVSFGFGCAQAGFPGVYTNIGILRDWIDNNTI